MKEYLNSKSKIKEIIKNIHYLVINDKFIIINREKNMNFIYKYRLNSKMIKNILLHININNYVKEEFDNDTLKYGIETVIIFIVSTRLIDFHGILNQVRVYIKIKLKENFIPVISIHEAKY